MKKNTAIMTGLFVLLILIFVINPMFFYQLQDNLLGKIIIISTLIYLTMNSVTLGLLFTLVLIILSHRLDNYSLIEGMKGRKKKPQMKVEKKRSAKEAKRRAQIAKVQAEAAKRRAEAEARAAEAKARAAEATATAEAIEAEVTDIQPAVDASNFAEFEDIITDMDMNTDVTETFKNGIDRISIEDTFRVKNPSTIPVSKEQFSNLGNIMPFDTTMELFGGMSSFV